MKRKNSIHSLLRNNKGSASVLTTLLFSALIIMIVVLVAAAKKTSGESYADATFQLAGRSILSEYDNRLYSDYGIIAFKGDEAQIESDIEFYSDASLSTDDLLYVPFVPAPETTSFFKPDYSINANLKEYSIISADIFAEQVKQAMLKKSIGVIAGAVSGENKVIKGLVEGDSPHNRVLRNEGVIESLPSSFYTDDSILPDFYSVRIPSVEELKDSASSKFFISEYIMAFFSKANDGMYSEERFFDNEVEYILSGKMRDEDNYKSVKGDIHLMRLGINATTILFDSKKMESVRLISKPFAALHPIAESVAAVLTVGVWAEAETQNDLKILEEGGNVAFVKSKNQWATDNIFEVVEGFFAADAIYPENRSGQNYEDYLRVMVYFSNKEKLIFRTMDLIQINLKATYNKDFLIKDYYAGFRFDATVNGKKFLYTEKY